MVKVYPGITLDIHMLVADNMSYANLSSRYNLPLSIIYMVITYNFVRDFDKFGTLEKRSRQKNLINKIYFLFLLLIEPLNSGILSMFTACFFII